jgi:hypothetical protein
MCARRASSVSTARNSRIGTNLLVSAFVWSRGGSTRLCGNLSKDRPPRCLNGLAIVAGRAPTDLESNAAGVAWSNSPRHIVVVRRDGGVEDVDPDPRP